MADSRQAAAEPGTSAPAAPGSSARILVAHGWLGGAWQIRGLVRHLTAAGFDAQPVRYPSAVAGFPAALAAARAAAGRAGTPLHLVGFSYGGLVMRALAAEAPPGLVSLLLIGTPNLGSPLARLACRVAPTPALRVLRGGAPVSQRLPSGLRIGCIAGSRPGLMGRLIAEPSDSRVPVASALGLCHHASLTLPLKHEALRKAPAMFESAVRFIAHGRF